MSSRRRNPPGAPLQMQQSVNMARAAVRPSSGCVDGTGLGYGTTLARGPDESAPHEKYEEHGRIAIRGRADGSEESREGGVVI